MTGFIYIIILSLINSIGMMHKYIHTLKDTTKGYVARLLKWYTVVSKGLHMLATSVEHLA